MRPWLDGSSASQTFALRGVPEGANLSENKLEDGHPCLHSHGNDDRAQSSEQVCS